MDKRVSKAPDTRRRHAEDLKLALVRRSLEPGASVAAIAQEAGVNANLLFNWRRLHQKAHRSAEAAPTPVLLPVTVVASQGAATSAPTSPAPRTASVGTIEIDIKGVRVSVDEEGIRAVLRALACVT